jgi:hypothetical protein
LRDISTSALSQLQPACGRAKVLRVLFCWTAVTPMASHPNYLASSPPRRQHLHLGTQDLDKYVVFKVGVLFTIIFLFFTTTTLVSFTLRETQERMLRFTFLLQHHIRNR